ncbi:Transcriptional regulatory protein TdiR [Enhygromyxa salina]|uniref:Transcriptional regulatory protein TdiR n=1 Tax=Enhygromyxa salina TaxID=215803 RepID=A0A2S9XGJ0_9BACT|nr:DNA-binding response regulator [Enhygromyxa salina]PRP91994.1 Transcriptional regulatory protein TdiR [Enhygromyxa salina]
MTTELKARRARAIIVEDEWIVARDLQHILEEIGLQIVRLVRRPSELLPLLDELRPELLVLDIDLSAEIDGIELAEQVQKTHPTCALLFVSAHAEPETLARIRRVDAHGFVVKPFVRPQLEAAVEVALARVDRTADNAQAALREIARVLADAGALPNERRNRDWRQIPGLDELSPREVQVLEALLAHRRPPQIAEDLGISPHTVRNHLKSIYAKCGVRSQAELLQLIVEG